MPCDQERQAFEAADAALQLAIVIAVGSIASVASATDCGFGVQSVGYSAPVAVQGKPAKVQARAAVSQSLYVFDQVPRIPRGSTRYYHPPKSYGRIDSLSLDRLTAQAIALQKAADQSHERSQSKTLEFLEEVVRIRDAQERITRKGRAAAEILKAAAELTDELDNGDGDHGQAGGWKHADKAPTIARVCAQCHVGGQAKGGLNLDNEFNIAKALGAVSSGTMPPGDSGANLSEGDRLAIVREFLSIAQADQ